MMYVYEDGRLGSSDKERVAGGHWLASGGPQLIVNIGKERRYDEEGWAMAHVQTLTCGSTRATHPGRLKLVSTRAGRRE
jgi:hypothetical protein